MQAQQPTTQREGSALKVLLVDDEKEICFLLHTMLERSGAKCRSAYSLAGAQEALGLDRYDVVFLDINLPDGLGYSLIPTIRRILPEARVIAISALDHEKDRAVERGADLFVSKPFNRGAILGALEQLGVNK
ncbi:MAG: response regulator [Flavobacteriales bacterium]|nr:response regulator [Flavobacteriales bacterium]